MSQDEELEDSLVEDEVHKEDPLQQASILRIPRDVFSTFDLMEEDIMVELGTYIFNLEAKHITMETMKKINTTNEPEELSIEKKIS